MYSISLVSLNLHLIYIKTTHGSLVLYNFLNTSSLQRKKLLSGLIHMYVLNTNSLGHSLIIHSVIKLSARIVAGIVKRVCTLVKLS